MAQPLVELFEYNRWALGIATPDLDAWSWAPEAGYGADVTPA
jgi:hypothetical protein